MEEEIYVANDNEIRIKESKSLDITSMNNYLKKYMDTYDKKRKKDRTFFYIIAILILAVVVLNPINYLKNVLENKRINYEKVDYFNNIKNSFSYTNSNTSSNTLIWPANGTLTSDYGYLHNGIDISCYAHNDAIRAGADGKVVFAGSTTNGYGNAIQIEHKINDETIYTFYAHLSSINVHVGEYVYQGELIGYEGGDPYSDPNPGNSTGHHLHFEVRTSPDAGSDINPYRYLDKK